MKNKTELCRLSDTSHEMISYSMIFYYFNLKSLSI